MKISVFPKVKEPKNIHEYDVTFERLYTFLSKYRTKVNKDKMVAWSPTTFSPKHRLAENAQEMTFLVLDVDQKEKKRDVLHSHHFDKMKEHDYKDGTYDMIFAELKRLEIRAIMHTSFSHRLEFNKFRIVFPLEKPIEAKKEIWRPIYRGACNWLHSYFGEGLTDSSTCDVSRAYYTSYHSDVFRCDYIDGKYIDWVSMGDEEKQREQERIDKKRAELQNKNKIRESHTKNIDTKRHISFSDYRRYMYDLLKYDYNSRHELALRLNARIIGNRAERWTCPDCLRNDATYFYIQPTTAYSLFCGHVNSCGDKKKPKWFSPGYIAEFYGLL